MSGIFYVLFYLAVLALVVGCAAYLLITPRQSKATRTIRRAPVRPSPESVREAQRIRGVYRLSSLEDLLAQMAALEAWGMVLEAQVEPDFGLHVQMIVDNGEVQLRAPSIDPRDESSFRELAEKAKLAYRLIEGKYCIDLAGTWPQIAVMTRRVLNSLYGAGDDKEVYFHVYPPAV